ncbi:beta-galactosidase [Neiella sp. HB171785]|uniref:Beta-galactosidase n=1 Tax=Neiella litorisoli TaxID=2771431 RepID=A0A8J6UQ16_9GAMM|nr:beta-galactosidase [Neiella litorisoli]MBD1390017.1 beta-galactosidase [Neiella litorisoli]
MKSSSFLIAPLMLALLAGCQADNATENKTINAAAHPQQEIAPLLDLTQATIPAAVKFYNASGEMLAGQGLHVEFDTAKHKYASVMIEPETPFDWSDLQDFNLAMDIANAGERSVQIYLDMTDIDGGNYTRTVAVPVGDSKTYYAKMSGHDLGTPDGEEHQELNFKSGLRSNPPTWESDETMFVSMWGKKNLNLKGISKIIISVQSSLYDKEITLSNVRLRQNPPFNENFLDHIVDQYGQNALVHFEGKVYSQADLDKAREQETPELTGQVMPGYSKFGGWADGPKLEATGFFRTAKYNGKWSLVDPEGYLYFSTGLDIVRLNNTATMTGFDYDQAKMKPEERNGISPEHRTADQRINKRAQRSRYVASDTRARMYRWLPRFEDKLGRWYGYRPYAHSGALKKGESFSFYGANLQRKYGDADPLGAWKEVSINRMLSWGFTSLGNWADPIFYDNGKIPYVANGWINGDYKTVSSNFDFWAPMPDVFDPVFEQAAIKTVKKVAAEVNDSPWCMGVFIDNEKSFGRGENNDLHYGIVINTLGRDGADVPTKAEFTRLMKAKYGTIEALNKAWDKNIASWQAFDKGIDSSLTNETQLKDYADLLHAYGDKYFSIVSAAIKKYLPNHMYLGSRFPDWGMPIEIVKAAAKHVDVVSYNIYKEGLHPETWGFLADIDMPSIIGEFHVGANDNGLFHPGLIHAADQHDRADMYTEYMESVIENPYFVGAHWFQYMDSPITGRAYDGENYNVGFVNVTDTPYRPMVEAARALHSQMYPNRFNSN